MKDTTCASPSHPQPCHLWVKAPAVPLLLSLNRCVTKTIVPVWFLLAHGMVSKPVLPSIQKVKSIPAWTKIILVSTNGIWPMNSTVCRFSRNTASSTQLGHQGRPRIELIVCVCHHHCDDSGHNSLLLGYRASLKHLILVVSYDKQIAPWLSTKSLTISRTRRLSSPRSIKSPRRQLGLTIPCFEGLPASQLFVNISNYIIVCHLISPVSVVIL